MCASYANKISCQVGVDWLVGGWLVGDKTNRFKLRHTQAHLIASQLQGLSDPLNHLQAEFTEQSSGYPIGASSIVDIVQLHFLVIFFFN